MQISQSLGYLLNAGARMIKRKLDDTLAQYGITTAQWAVLKLLDEKKKQSQAQIADELKSDRATVGSVIFRLIDKQLVQKELDPEDRRSYLVTLTTQAEEIVRRVERMAAQVNETALDGISGQDRQLLMETLSKIIANLSDGVME